MLGDPTVGVGTLAVILLIMMGFLIVVAYGFGSKDISERETGD